MERVNFMLSLYIFFQRYKSSPTKCFYRTCTSKAAGSSFLFTLKFLSSRLGLIPLPVFCLEMHCLIFLCLLCLDIALLLTLMLSFHWTLLWLQDIVPHVLRAHRFIGTLEPSTCAVLVARSCVLEKNMSSLIVSSNSHRKFENVNIKGKTKKKNTL